MNSNSEDFPVPVSPTRRRVYGLFSMFLDVLIIPSLRDSTSLKCTVRPMPENMAGAHLMAGMAPSSSESYVFKFSGAFLRGSAESLTCSSNGSSPLEILFESAILHDFEFLESLTAWV
jgi:hypothetical protein